MLKGIFISLEGVDGSGKTSLKKNSFADWMLFIPWG